LIEPFLIRKELKILDAGAGTGRWSLILHSLFKNKARLRFDLVDITKKMLAEADRKIKKRKLINIMETHLGNIEDLSAYPDDHYDMAISFYNVLSFTEKPDRALKEVFKKLKKGGLYASIVANKYHSYFFAILTNRIGELANIRKGKIRYNKEMPSIHCFTPDEIRGLYRESGFKKVEVIGFPKFVYPNIEDTLIEGQSRQSRNILKDKKTFQKIIDVEFQECFNQDLAGRGNVLLVIGKK
jgi:ubiquinone/menaquinone biosynthesis C-methylase UbiE